METLKGKSASNGTAIGEIFFYKEENAVCGASFTDNIDEDIERLKKSLETAKNQLDEIYQKA
jgi:phosphoenolpyruvate-protein kinase (PTS system EI component)